MDGSSSISAIDQKMAEMRIKNLELLKRHQEVEEDRQLAEQSSAATVESPIVNMQHITMNRRQNAANQQYSSDNQHERVHRPPARRKFDNDRVDNQPHRAQRVDYNRLKRERAQETIYQQYTSNSINPELLEYAYPSHYRSENNHANRVGSGRFNQQKQRTQEQGQRRREERMRRSGIQNNDHPGGASELHLDVPPMPFWNTGPVPPPLHVQLLPTNIHSGMDPLMNNGGEQFDQSNYLHNFMYPSPVQSPPFNNNGTVYFTHPVPLTMGPSSAQPHFHHFYPTRTFENSNRHQYHHSSHFQPPSVLNSHTPDQQQQQDPSVDLPPRFRRPKRPDQENTYQQPRPMSGDFERLNHSSSFSRFNNGNRFQARPQSFYDFSSQPPPPSATNPSYNRYQRNSNNYNLPLSAYMNTDDSSYPNENLNNHWGTTYQRRRPTQPRSYHQDKHQFPLSSYDPRQYGFNSNNYQKRNDFNNRSNSNRRHPQNSNPKDQNNDIDLIEEWWEDDNPELIGADPPTANIDSQATGTVNDSGNSSLSTSIHLKESTLDDEETNVSANGFISPPSDSNIIESLDQLEEQLKLEEAVEQQLASETDFPSLTKEPTTYDTAHFMQWAKEKFREELAGRLTSQEIEQHDAVTTDDEDVDDLLLKTDVNMEKCPIDHATDEDNDQLAELEDDLNEKLTMDETTTTKFIVVE